MDVMLGVAGIVAKVLGRDRVSDLAERVAGRSRMGVWQRVLQRLPTLGPTEGRGYLRARAIAVVREETSRLMEQEGAAVSSYRYEIEEAALHLLVTMISSQFSQTRSHDTRRRAA
jgi:hypothetical protein